jgi:ABC-type spermidine/putrescine transport system permease subunit II
MARREFPAKRVVMLLFLPPSVPFVVPTMTPFIEQIDTRIEPAARICGARTPAVLFRVLAPLLLPGVLAAGIRAQQSVDAFINPTQPVTRVREEEVR